MENEELQQKIAEVESLLSNARANFNELGTLKDEAVNLRRNIQSRSTEADNKYAEISGLKTRADQAEQQINAHLAQVSTIVSQISQYQPTFDALKNKVDDPDDGIKALHEEVQTFHVEVENLKKESDKVLIDIKGRFADVEKIKEETITAHEYVKEIAKDSESLKDSIREHLELVTDSVLQNAFKEREKKLTRIVWVWLGVTVLSVIGFAIGVLHVFNKLADVGFSGYSEWYRLLFVTPLLFLVGWSARNYSQERKLLERYAFKAVISTSLTSYIKLLSDRFSEAQEDILAFTKEALGKIYKEPYEDVESKVRGNISLWNVVKADIELDEKTKERIVEQVAKPAVKEE